MTDRPITRKLPAHRGCFSYGRIPLECGGVTYRLFRRTMEGRLYYEPLTFSRLDSRSLVARELNIARHRLRNTVDEIDLEIMGVTQ